ncbi:Wzz/FepE/Etk N-terminal domain-containing protein [Gammaproteobacteria bacterium]|nr:Wzz/FepE/Etk N-terminal domain-containing protein [Gammaproteobacteria bacterium]
MTKENENNSFNKPEDTFDLKEIILVVWNDRLKVLCITILIAITSIVYALILPNEYTSVVFLAPSDAQQGSLSQIQSSGSSSTGGLASIAGSIGIGGAGKATTLTSAVKIMESWGFIETFIKENNLASELLAVREWDSKSNELILDESKYDSSTQTWIGAEPSSWELFREWDDEVSVYHDMREGFVIVTADHLSPVIAKKWVDLLVESINQYMRERSLLQSNLNIEYLKEQIEKTSVAEMQEVFFRLIEEQTKMKMLAEANTQYAFTVVSKAMIAEEKSSPTRKLIVIGATIVGGILSIFIVIALNYKNKIIRALRS